MQVYDLHSLILMLSAANISDSQINRNSFGIKVCEMENKVWIVWSECQDGVYLRLKERILSIIVPY